MPDSICMCDSDDIEKKLFEMGLDDKILDSICPRCLIKAVKKIEDYIMKHHSNFKPQLEVDEKQ